VTAVGSESLGRAFLAAAVLLVLVWGVLTGGALLEASFGEVDAVALRTLLEAAGATLAVIVGVLFVIHWRLSGEVRPLWLGASLIWFGAFTLGFATLLPTVQPRAIDPVILDWIRAASRLVVISAITYSAFTVQVDSRLRLRHLLLPMAAATAVVTVLFQVAPGVGLAFAGVSEQAVSAGSVGFGSAVLMAIWGIPGGIYLWAGRRERRPLFAWFGLMLVGIALAEFTRALTLAQGEMVWSAAAEILRGAALLTGLTGVTLELQRAFNTQRGNLMVSMVSALTAEARFRAEKAEQEERAHEARNALTAIEGATRTLEHYRDRLPAAARAQLATAITAEIARLQRLVSSERIIEAVAPFNVAEALAPAVTGARAQGMLVESNVPPELVALGRWADTAEVVQNVLENARRYASGSPVALIAHAESDTVVVRVDDRGPGVPAEEREKIFQRGQRGTASPDIAGSGLGLYVSHQLMREQGGDLWVEDAPGGGASFGLRLPAADPAMIGGSGTVPEFTSADARD
jgi:signal transduction histidine kinase